MSRYREYDPRFVETSRSRGVRRRTAAVALVLSGLSLPACDDGADADRPTGSSTAPHPDAAGYLAAITSILLPDGIPDDPLPILFVVPLEDAIGLETQAFVIDGLAETHDVRFVDDLAAAVDVDQPGVPPRDDATVLGLGTVAADPPHLVRLEQYRSAGDVAATLVTLTYLDDHWTVDSTETVPAEVLVDGL